MRIGFINRKASRADQVFPHPGLRENRAVAIIPPKNGCLRLLPPRRHFDSAPVKRPPCKRSRPGSGECVGLSGNDVKDLGADNPAVDLGGATCTGPALIAKWSKVARPSTVLACQHAPANEVAARACTDTDESQVHGLAAGGQVALVQHCHAYWLQNGVWHSALGLRHEVDSLRQRAPYGGEESRRRIKCDRVDQYRVLVFVCSSERDRVLAGRHREGRRRVSNIVLAGQA